MKHLLLIFAFFLVMTMPTQAHDWYTGERNPGTGDGCCGGNDCFMVQLEWLSEDDDNYIVTLPVNGDIQKYGVAPVHYKFPKKDAMPTKHIDVEDKKDTGWHACIWGGKARCFFFPSGS